MHIYVDGSYNSKTKHWGGGVLICDDSEQVVIQTLSVSGPDVNGSRQINGELESAIMALDYVKNHVDALAENEEVKLYYDYQGIESWANNEWKANKPVAKSYKTRVNRILLELRFMHGVTVNFEKVKSHSGVKMNDIADRVCGEACGVK